MRRSLAGALLRLAVFAGLAGLGAALLTSGYDAHQVRSPTMAPTLHPGDRGFFSPVTDPDDVHRGDVVRFRAPWQETAGSGPLVFRVIGIGGDEVSCCADGLLIRNGRAVDGPGTATRHAGTSADQFRVRVPAGRIFVVGDAGSLANDSRQHLDLDGGTVAATTVTGRLVGVGWPLWRWHPVPGPGRGVPVVFLAASAAVSVGLVGLGFQLVAVIRRGLRSRGRLAGG